MLTRYIQCGHIGRMSKPDGRKGVAAFIRVAEIREAVEVKDGKCPDCKARNV